MEWNTIYEIAKEPFPIEACFYIVVTLVALKELLSFFLKYRKEKCLLSTDYAWIVFFILLFIGGSVFAVLSLQSGGSEDAKYAEAYYNEEYEIVEGELEQYTEVKENMVEFSVGDKSFMLHKHDNPIPKKGYLKVYYVWEYDLPIVVRVDCRETVKS